MPVATQDETAPAGRIKRSILIPASKAVLSCLCALDLSNVQEPNDAWVAIGLMSGGTTDQNIVATLASGYIGRDTPTSWSGKIILDSEMYMYANVYSTFGGIFRLVALINPYKVDERGGIILDP